MTAPESYKTALVWFKNDLRLHDNEVLYQAIRQSEKVLYVYCLDKKLFEINEFGFAKTDYVRYLFLKQSVLALQTNLERKGAHLVIHYGVPEEFLSRIITTYKVDAIFAEQEYAAEELDMIEKVTAALPNHIDCHFIWGKTLYHIDDIPFKIADIPETSKAYRIPTGKQTVVRKEFPIPEDLKAVQHVSKSNFPTEKALKMEKPRQEVEPYLPGGEDKALERLQYYTFDSELLTGYRWSRNRSEGYDYSSKFSPYLAVGSISPRRIYNQIQEYEIEIKKNQSTWWLVFELVWRDYFTFKMMKAGNKVFRTQGYKGQNRVFENEMSLFKRWCLGQTGIPFVDAHMRQLNATGYMSNRGRVNCSSFLVHDYKINWMWGAAYFESKLIDYDVSSNWMNWHVQAFEIWYTNPVHQSLKYKADSYIKKWIPELAEVHTAHIHAPWLLTASELEETNYPIPTEIYSKWTRSINTIKKAIEV